MDGTEKGYEKESKATINKEEAKRSNRGSQ